jgi:TusA-related sulfurtransferase
MEAEILDLREQRCPLSLLLVKRKMHQITRGSALIIQIRDRASLTDIQAFLSSHSHVCQCKQINDTFQLDVIKGPN